jgi:DNA-nicking Smr family endonuclease
MSRRDLNPQDLKLWRHVTRNVAAYESREAFAPDEDEPPPLQAKRPAELPIAQTPTKKNAPQPPISIGRTDDMDRKQARRLKRGELPIDARLDLHGLTLERAHAALTGFIRGSHGSGARLVVVVTGKGPEGRGRIRSEAPHWLNAPDLRPLILAVTQAPHHQGGGGALYVLLKRRR